MITVYIYIHMCICTYMQYYIHTRSILASLNPVGASFCLFRNVLKQAACFGREKHIETIASACVHHPKIPHQFTTHEMFMKCSWRTNMGATGSLLDRNMRPHAPPQQGHQYWTRSRPHRHKRPLQNIFFRFQVLKKYVHTAHELKSLWPCVY